MGASVVTRGDSAEAFLSSSVPDLEFDDLVVVLNSPDFLARAYEVHSDGRDEGLSIGVVSEAQKKAGLPYS
jgi:hypothetical protein